VDREDKHQIRIAVVTLLGQHRRMIQTYAYAITGDFSLTDDIFQEVSLAVVDHWDEIPAEPGVVPWLKEVTRRRSLEALRRFGRRHALLDEEVLERIGAAVASEARERAASDHRREVMSRCVEKLQGDARAVVTARYWEDLSCEEIARRIGRTVKSVYGVLARSRLALVECFQKHLILGREGR